KDVHLGVGGFGCVPSSHKCNFVLPKEWHDLENPAPCVRAVPGKAGSAIFFTEALTHGTMPWRGADERRTLFLKYCPRHMAWSRSYITGENEPGLTEAQRQVLRTPGMYPR
ncbi:MAG: mitomycin antibiotics/polyketide fumonisin biosynthesis protein, partial [Armatimonadetes bacterium]|nr:mitomycin antibiotics/polyketide fumonisin biosynthesis protein [Armatimonadota bacterium]